MARRPAPAPRVISYGDDDEAQWLVTEALPGSNAIGEDWRRDPAPAIRAIAAGLRALHALPVDDFPPALAAESWAGRMPAALGTRPPIAGPVVVHGDACAPNTLLSARGSGRATSTSAISPSATAGPISRWPR